MRFLFLFVIFNIILSDGFAQNTSEQVYRFVYIAHDFESMGVDNADALRVSLAETKKDIYNSRMKDPGFFYLSNGMSFESSNQWKGEWHGDENALQLDTIRMGNPIVIRINVNPDNTDDFENVLLGEIQNSLAHDVNTNVDLENILHMLEETDFLNEFGEIKYSEVEFDFYVNPRFWEQHLHEKLIAALYFVLDAKKFDSTRFRFNIHHLISDASKRPDYWQGQKADFGLWNIENINNSYPKVQLMY